MLTRQGKNEEICNSHASLVRDNTSFIKLIVASMKCLSDMKKKKKQILLLT
jgi:hypothetical protein